MRLEISAEIFFVRETKLEVREAMGVAVVSFYLSFIILEKVKHI